ncbi:MAG: hypothetical protein LBJ58_01955 [Tannerellaceae bacterium]|jgi:hypothetical protein|nr:hypothetical protein [Tannerellaceae bacterium]
MSKWMKMNHDELYSQLLQVTEHLSVPSRRKGMGFGSGTPEGIWYEASFLKIYEDYVRAHEAWLATDMKNREATVEFLTAEKAVRDAFHMLYTNMLDTNDLVTDEDLVAMTLPERRRRKSNPAVKS